MVFNYPVNKMKYTFFFISLLLLLFSCKEKENKDTDFKTRPHSELAMLMLQMEQSHQDFKNQLEKGEKIQQLPMDYNLLLTSKPTFASDVDSVFFHYAKNYIKTANELVKAENQKEKYNQLVDACIQCHENKCGGPIVRIKKLYLKD